MQQERSDSDQDPTPERTELPPVLCHAYREISAMLRILRNSRDTLEQATTEKLHLTSAKLEEVSSATEVAATGMLDGLDRALGLVDELDELDASGNARAAETRSRLRDELFQSINHLQFQDITTQQLNYASNVLLDIEHRLAEIVKNLDPGSIALPEAFSNTDVQSNDDIMTLESAGIMTFDPDASLCDAERRQAIADAIFARLD